MELYKEVKQLTLEEVKKHDGVMEKTVWVVIRDIVYDVTEYMEDHPGGSDLILEHAGKDGTKDFENTGHSNDAKKELKKYKIGEIIEAERKGKIKNKEPKMETNSDEIQSICCLSYLFCGLCG